MLFQLGYCKVRHIKASIRYCFDAAVDAEMIAYKWCCESESTSLNLLLFATIILRVKGRIESKTGSISN